MQVELNTTKERAVEFYRTELTNPSMEIRQEAVKQACSIVKFVGEQLAVEMIIPMLTEIANKDCQQVVYRVVTTLPDLVEILPVHPYLLQFLCLVEPGLASAEDTVRLQSVLVAKMLLLKSASSQLVQGTCAKLTEFIQRLASGSLYQHRLSAGELLPDVYALVQQERGEWTNSLMILFQELSKSPVPMVRIGCCRSTYRLFSGIQTIPSILTDTEKAQYSKLLIEVSDVLLNDMDEDVTVAALDGCIPIFVDFEQFCDNPTLLGTLQSISRQPSARQKASLAHQLDTVINKRFSKTLSECKCTPNSNSIAEQFLQLYVKLLADEEIIVKIAAAEHIDLVMSLLDRGVADQVIWPLFPTLIEDQDPKMRLSVVKKIPAFLRVFSTSAMASNENGDIIVKGFMNLLGDEDASVRDQAVATFLNDIMLSIPAEQRNFMVKQLYLGTLNPNAPWRVVDAVVQAIPATVQALGESWVIEAKGLDFLHGGLFHSVNQVRKHTRNQLPSLCEKFGPEWIHRNVTAVTIDKFDASRNRYMIRIGCLAVIGTVLDLGIGLSADAAKLVIVALEDNVANVRYKANKVLIPLMNHDRSQVPLLKASIKQLFDGETDPEVKDAQQKVLTWIESNSKVANASG